MITPLEVYSAKQDTIEACMNEFNRYQKAVEDVMSIKVVSVESRCSIAAYHLGVSKVITNIYFIRESIKSESETDEEEKL